MKQNHLLPWLYRVAAAAFLVYRVTAASAFPVGNQDLYVAQGTGPYQLSWTGICQNTDTIVAGGDLLNPLLDYRLDLGTGKLQLLKALPAGTIITASYDYDTDTSRRAADAVTLPYQTDLAHFGDVDLQLSAKYQSDDALASDPSNTSLQFGIAAAWKAAAGESVTARWICTPAVGESTAEAALSTEDSGLVVIGETPDGHPMRLRVDAGMAGRGMSGADNADGLNAGDRRVAADVTVAPTKTVQADIKAGMDDHSTTGTLETTDGASITATPTGALKISANINADRTGGTNPTDVTQSGAGVALTGPDHTQVNVGYTQSAGQGAGDTSDVQMTAKTDPGIVGLTGNASHILSDGQRTDAGGVGLSLTPIKAISVGTSVETRQTPLEQAATASATGAIEPLKYVQIAGGYDLRTAWGGSVDPKDLADGSSARVSLGTASILQLSGTYAVNPADSSGSVQLLDRRGLGVAARLGFLSVDGGYDWSQSAAELEPDTSLHVNLGFHLSSATQLLGGYTEQVSGADDDVIGARQYTFGLHHALGDTFVLNLDGTLKQAAQPAAGGAVAAPEMTAAASLGVKF